MGNMLSIIHIKMKVLDVYSYFPNPYPEETLYSLLARYNMYSGNIKDKHTIKDLFGFSSKRATSEFITGIEILLSRFPLTGLSSRDLIYKHTSFPFYSAFLPQERVEKNEEQMLFLGKGICNSIGINASSVTNLRYLHHCKLCISDDLNQYGETYWHRVHQLPGVVLCPKHKVPLIRLIKQLYEYSQHSYLLASDNLDDYTCNQPFNDNLIKQLFEVSLAAQWLLNSQVIMPDYCFYREKYLAILKERNIASANGRVNQKEFIKLFQERYDTNFLNSLEIDLHIDSEKGRWLKSIVRQHRSGFHPIKHILVILFLFETLSDFYAEEHKYSPFGEGPWPCLNPVHTHFREKVITNIEISTNVKNKKPIGFFRCFCGFEYSRTGPDKEENDAYRRDRLINTGTMWSETLKTLTQQGIATKTIAQRLDVDSKTVKTKLAKLRNAKNDKTSNRLEAEALDKHRQTWLNMRDNNPGMSLSQLRKLNGNEYMWLYRNDRVWLNENTPPKDYRGQHSNIRINWVNRDIELVEEVKTIVSNWYIDEIDRPIRITKTCIANKSKRPYLIINCMNKLPVTLKFIQTVVENREQFRLRRIDWAEEKLLIENKAINKWNLLRKAGIRLEYISDNINEYVQNKIRESGMKL